MNETRVELLYKIKRVLVAVNPDNIVFKDAAVKLDEVLIDETVDNFVQLKAVLADCYHLLVMLENENALTVAETVLLNDIEQLDDLIVRGEESSF